MIAHAADTRDGRARQPNQIWIASIAPRGRRDTVRASASNASSPRLVTGYFRRISASTWGARSGPSRAAVAGAPGALGLPRIEHGATVTRWVRRIRRTLPVSGPVHTRRWMPSTTNQTGVATGVPSARNVVSSRYRAHPVQGGGIEPGGSAFGPDAAGGGPFIPDPVVELLGDHLDG